MLPAELAQFALPRRLVAAGEWRHLVVPTPPLSNEILGADACVRRAVAQRIGEIHAGAAAEVSGRRTKQTTHHDRRRAVAVLVLSKILRRGGKAVAIHGQPYPLVLVEIAAWPEGGPQRTASYSASDIQSITA